MLCDIEKQLFIIHSVSPALWLKWIAALVCAFPTGISKRLITVKELLISFNVVSTSVKIYYSDFIVASFSFIFSLYSKSGYDFLLSPRLILFGPKIGVSFLVHCIFISVPDFSA